MSVRQGGRQSGEEEKHVARKGINIRIMTSPTLAARLEVHSRRDQLERRKTTNEQTCRPSSGSGGLYTRSRIRSSFETKNGRPAVSNRRKSPLRPGHDGGDQGCWARGVNGRVETRAGAQRSGWMSETVMSRGHMASPWMAFHPLSCCLSPQRAPMPRETGKPNRQRGILGVLCGCD